MKKIGITLRLYHNDNDKYYINNIYIFFFNQFNFIPYYLTYNYKKDILYELDAFIITGGYDLNPLYYNENNISSNNIILENDLLDQEIINYCLISNKPLLGICRGIQSINVFLDGSLHQDLAYISKIHKNNINSHFVLRQNDSILLDKLPKRFIVNSYHHQGIKKLGSNLITTSITENNLIESIEHIYKPIFGVQWHPELLNDKNNIILFNNFLKTIK